MIGLVLVLAAVALLVMERSTGPPVTAVPVPELDGEPDVYMEGAAVSQYGDDGTLEYRLEMARASHFQGEAETRLVEPRLTLYRRDEPPWHVHARRGVLRRPLDGGPDAETVSLAGDVTLEQRRGDEWVRLVTEALMLYPKRQYAETDRDVMIQGVFGRTTASGLQGDLRAGALQLFSAPNRPVRTVLQPEHFKSES